MTKNLHRFLRSYPVHRALVAGLSFGAAIMGARLLPSDRFSELMTAAFLAKFMQITNFGATSGYFVSRYGRDANLKWEFTGTELNFLKLYLAQLGAVGVLMIAISASWMHEYLLGAVAFLLLVPLYVSEPSVRYRRHFSFSLAPEFILASSLSLVLAAYLIGISEEYFSLIYIIVIAAIMLGVMNVIRRRASQDFNVETKGFSLKDHLHVLKLGFPVYMGSALFLLAFSMDRLILPLHGSSQQIAIYFLANQLVVGSMIFITAINFVNTVDLGERRKESLVMDFGMVQDKFRLAVKVAIASYIALVVGGYVLEKGFLPQSFTGLTIFVAVLGFGLASFYSSNAITPIVAYFQRQMPLTVSLGGVALILAANNAWVYLSGRDVIWLAVGTAFVFVLHSAFSVWFTFSILKNQSDEQT